MLSFFSERIAYGRAIRDEAAWLVREHGAEEAERQARTAAVDPARDACERAFFALVAARLGRELRHRTAEAQPEPPAPEPVGPPLAAG